LHRCRPALCAVLAAFTFFPAPRIASAQPRADEPAIVIVRRPGREDGEAQMTINGKVRKISPHAVAAFRVRGGQSALIIGLEPAKGKTAKTYVLHYYDLDSGRRRLLGTVPLNAATLAETDLTGDSWAFALAGKDAVTGKPVIIAGDEEGIPGLLMNATAPAINHGALAYQRDGQQQDAKLDVLLGWVKTDIYEPSLPTRLSPKLLQVFGDGTALTVSADGTINHPTWHTDGETLEMHTERETAPYRVPWADLAAVPGVPAGKMFGVRLEQALSSRTTHEGDTVKAVSVTPVVVNGVILIPAGSEFEGKVVQADNTGWGFKHETASLTLHWHKATLPEGRELSLDMRVFQVENARESVTSQGKIQGIRSTATPGYTAENGVLTFAGIDPIAYVFASAAGSAVLGFAEPEILYPAGTELVLDNLKPLLTAQAYPPTIGPSAESPAQQEALQSFVKTLPYRTKTKGSNKDSDVTNLVFVGSAAGLERAFRAAGWLPADELTAGSTFQTLKTLSGNQNYTQAPMSILLLDEREPILALGKTTNTFFARHHLRIFTTGVTRDGHEVLTASSTQDIGIAFSRKQKTFIHVIDEHIDNERSKIVNDLVFTGCVENLDMAPRPWVPRDSYNSTGDRLLTDGAAAVLRMSDCQNPRTTPHDPAPRPPRDQRIARDTSLTIRNGLYRGNFVYQGIAGAFAVRRYLRSSQELAPDYGSWRMTDASGARYKGYDLGSGLESAQGNKAPSLERRAGGVFNPAPTPEDLAALQKAKEDHKWDPPRYELALEGGYMHMLPSYLSAVGVIEESSNPSEPTYFLFIGDNVGDGWAAGGSVTVNSWRHFSNEFSYFRQQVKYELGSVAATIPAGATVILDDSDLDVEKIGLVTRQFEYNLLLQPTRPTSRWRPYLAVGPALQLIALNGAPLKKPAGVFNVGLKNIGLIKAAFDFGSTPPLDGGGIFRIGLNYGAGVKYRVRPRVIVRADWRETWSKNPDIIATSYEDYEVTDLDDTYSTTVINVSPNRKFIQDRYTLGVAFTF
jgi:LssY C-terminus